MALNAEDDWEPPSQSEMKVIQARRERQDKISKLMGGYLLKGYKMLGECCEECSDDWEPPSQSEMKVIQARRERQDKISKLMGGYLLKGYRMLGECCEECSFKGSYTCAFTEMYQFCMREDDWEPPSQSEMKVIQARRERQDKISKLMGGYLLKGYKMLGECCEECSTILMQDKQKKNYCVACQELDSDMDKDNPVASPSPNHIGPFPNALESAEDALLQKLQWATRELQHATSIESSVQLCNLIRSCAESLRSIKELQL
ncbi:UNVERIFIED_CONTAM: hypothetical protein FKN15_038876 [Acipenser sinensis]